METKLYLVLALFISFNVSAQVSSKYTAFAKEYSKEESLFKAKEFLIKSIIDLKENETIEFYVDPLAAASSGELTTLIYKCEQRNLEGMLLVFYGNYWNEEGVVFQGYGFKNLNREEAYAFFKKIDDAKEEHKKFLMEDVDNNNITFKFDDMQFIIWGGWYKYRVFWNRFDSSWESVSYDRTRKRFEKKMD